MSNRLKNEKSPYLLQHKENPVDWYPWCDEAFQKAAWEDKPVFLSIGYSTCHWCHVMAHESFEDDKVAALLNHNYICVKVDREERPDIDAVYMSVCQAMTGSGGWPLTVVTTPEQKPFFAGTYFPKESYMGHIGLMDILEEISGLWRSRRKDLEDAGEQVTAAIQRKTSPKIYGSERELIQGAYGMFLEQFDSVWGGFGDAPKFPAPHNLLFLMRYFEAEHEPRALYMAERTLEAMADGGIHDHIGGGFSRYSTDKKWLVPHFEKMLYDNGLLILAYAEAYRLTGKGKYADTIRRTADYILRELTDGQGGFYCGQDADSEGVEGKYYVFTPKEIEKVLGKEDGAEFCRQYGIREEGNFEGKCIPNRMGGEQKEWGRDDPRIQKLYEYRLRRTRLHKDDKILLSWNGWAIMGLARAGALLREKRYLMAAERAVKFVEEKMTGEGSRLFLGFRGGKMTPMGQLDDYAVYTLALLELYRVTFDIAYLENGIFRARQMAVYFEDQADGGYYRSPCDVGQLIDRPKEIYDGAMPSGNSVAAMVLQKLAYLTGEKEWQERARRQLEYCIREAGAYPAGYSFALLAVAEAFYPHREVVCTISDENDEEWKKHVDLTETYGQDILLKTRENEKVLAECAPFTAEYPLPLKGRAYYVCENGACSVPVYF